MTTLCNSQLFKKETYDWLSCSRLVGVSCVENFECQDAIVTNLAITFPFLDMGHALCSDLKYEFKMHHPYSQKKIQFFSTLDINVL